MGGMWRARLPHGMAEAVRRRRVRRGWLAAAIAAGCTALAVPAVVAYACVGLIGLSASPTSVQSGGTLTLTGLDFVPAVPVLIHLDTIDGPVITTVTKMTGNVMNSQFHETITVPSSVTPGQHVLIATQDAHNMNGGNPGRAVIYVGQAAPAASGPEARPASATLDTGPSWSILALIALGAAVVGLIVFGFFALRQPRRPSAQAGGA